MDPRLLPVPPAPPPPPPPRPKLVGPVAGWQQHITSHVGHRESPEGIGSTNHAGLDIGVATGTPIQAVKDGEVVFAGDAGGYGNMVVIKHDDGTFTKYAHQSSLNVKQGQQVKAGDVIGKVGSTGHSTGPHLHFEVRRGDWNSGQVLDPVAYLKGAVQVAAVDPGNGYSPAGGSGDHSTVSGGGATAGIGMGGGGSAGGGVAPAPMPDTPVEGSAVPAGKFGSLLARLSALGLTLEELKRLAEKYGVPLAMLLGVIMQESGGNPNAKSPAGAQGLMQLMPDTARGLGVDNPFDPKQNVEGGAKYLGQMLEQFGKDPAHALAAYNAGPGNVEKYGGIPPFSETRQYVANILASLDNATEAIG